MKNIFRSFILLVFLTSLPSVFGQVVIYTEDFDGPLTWTINTDIGVEGANPNNWYISCEEEGLGAGNCGEACGAGDQTLHISPNPVLGDLGAAYAETGASLTDTDRRAESGDISTIGHVDLTLEFDMIGWGNADDFAEVFYSIDGGASWTSIDGPLTSFCCGGIPCTGVEQGLWETKTYALPAECEEIPNLRISFVWQNVDDGVATDPSIAIDNITISKPVVVVDGGPTALFDPEDITICQGETITYTDLSTTDDVITDWNWVFDGGTPASALTVGPHDVTYPTPGVYTTTLTVTDGIGSHDTSFTVTVLDGPYSGESTTYDLCEGETIDLNTLIPGADAGGTWMETSGVPSGMFDEPSGVIDGAGLTPGDVFTFDYETGPGVAPCDFIDVATITVTIIDCEPLLVGFTYDDIVCVGDCQTFVDTSLGVPVTWLWDFGGAIDPPTSDEANPRVCFDTPGIYDIQLTVTNAIGESASTTNSITVFESPTVDAEKDTIIELGGTAFLVATGSIPDGSYIWTPDDYLTCDDCQTTTASPVDSITYKVTLRDVNGCTATDSVLVLVNFVEALGVADAFSPNDDGNNDILYVQGLGLAAMKFSVYNKYGEKVFESQTQSIGWDGTFRGRPQNSGVFTWVLDYTFVNGSGGTLKGTTTLIR